jgi:dolichol-phosphate mannosyltransferase
MEINNLWVVMPVYNEEEAIGGVIDEWRQVLQETGVPYVFCILNDGSRDRSLEILREYERRYQEIKVIDKPNSGHGQTCLYGYRAAGADWVLQIDSDGQCAPKYFPRFVDLSREHKAVFGFRRTRDDGFARWMVSRFVSLFTFAATGRWIRDANVPYRLVHRSLMEEVVQRIPDYFFLVNIYASVLIRNQEKIRWVPIHFRDRSGGSPSIKPFSFVRHGLTLFRQLRSLR